MTDIQKTRRRADVRWLTKFEPPCWWLQVAMRCRRFHGLPSPTVRCSCRSRCQAFAAPTSHPSTGYGPALRLLERYADRYPFEEMVTHEFGLDQVETAMRTSMSPDSMKVAVVPGLDRDA